MCIHQCRRMTWYFGVSLLAVWLVTTSCSKAIEKHHPNTLEELMESYGYTPLSPPETGWKIGSIVEIQPGQGSRPELRAIPESLGLFIAIQEGDVPDQRTLSTRANHLSAGASLPGFAAGRLTVFGASDYALRVSGNKIIRAQLDYLYPPRGFLIPEPQATRWEELQQIDQLFCIYALWSAREVAVELFDSTGVKLNMDSLAEGGAFHLEQYKWDSGRGLLIYSGSDPIILGYKARSPNFRRSDVRKGGGGGVPDEMSQDRVWMQAIPDPGRPE